MRACPSPRIEHFFYTVGRGPVPRRASVFTANVRGLWAAGVLRLGRTIAGDRPPRYGKTALPRQRFLLQVLVLLSMNRFLNDQYELT